MKSPISMETLLMNTATALAVGSVLLGAYALVTDPEDDPVSAEQLAKDDAVQAAKDADEREQIVWRVCRSLHAERAQVLETVDGDLVCRRRGEVL